MRVLRSVNLPGLSPGPVWPRAQPWPLSHGSRRVSRKSPAPAPDTRSRRPRWGVRKRRPAASAPSAPPGARWPRHLQVLSLSLCTGAGGPVRVPVRSACVVGRPLPGLPQHRGGTCGLGSHSTRSGPAGVPSGHSALVTGVRVSNRNERCAKPFQYSNRVLVLLGPF